MSGILDAPPDQTLDIVRMLPAYGGGNRRFEDLEAAAAQYWEGRTASGPSNGMKGIWLDQMDAPAQEELIGELLKGRFDFLAKEAKIAAKRKELSQEPGIFPGYSDTATGQRFDRLHKYRWADSQARGIAFVPPSHEDVEFFDYANNILGKGGSLENWLVAASPAIISYHAKVHAKDYRQPISNILVTQARSTNGALPLAPWKTVPTPLTAPPAMVRETTTALDRLLRREAMELADARRLSDRMHSMQAMEQPGRPTARLLHTEQALLDVSHRTSVQFWENQSTASIVASLRTGLMPNRSPGEALIVNAETGLIMQGNTRVWILTRRHNLTAQQVVDIIEGRATIPGEGIVGPSSTNARQRFDDLFRD